MEELTEFQRKMADNFPEIKLFFWEPMKKHTSFRIGGNAEVMAVPKSEAELSNLLKMSVLWDIKPAILGAGTNVLAPDGDLPGLVIRLKDGLDGITLLDGGIVRAMAGVTMGRLAVFAAKAGLAGLEFAHGIPGTVGGGIYMNAGAYGGEIAGVFLRGRIMNPDGTVREVTRKDMDFSYRHSRLEEEPGIVLSGEFALTADDPEAVFGRMKTLAARRAASQPLDMPSAGSAFKRPAGGYAAALIQDAGLKGFRIGGAAISEKHAGFAVNLGDATAEDVKTLLREVSDRVYARSGIRLEPEIRVW